MGVYEVDWFDFNGRRYPRILQDAGGPCPLIAVCNVLIMRRVLQIPPRTQTVSFEYIVKALTKILNDRIRRLSFQTADTVAALIQQNDDVQTLLPNVEEGLVVNAKFSGSEFFEFTRELSLFDTFDIPCYHCWRCDKQHRDFEIIEKLSYNEMVDILTMDTEQVAKDQNEEAQLKLIQQQEALRDWLTETQTQITAAGVAELHEKLQPGAFAILFRNNHFSTIHRTNEGNIYSMVTDVGIVLTDPNIIWNTVTDLEGDDKFLDTRFRSLTQRRRIAEHQHQEMRDAQLARALVQQEMQDERIAAQIHQAELDRQRKVQRMYRGDQSLQQGKELRKTQSSSEATCCIIS